MDAASFGILQGDQGLRKYQLNNIRTQAASSSWRVMLRLLGLTSSKVRPPVAEHPKVGNSFVLRAALFAQKPRSGFEDAEWSRPLVAGDLT